MPGTKEFSFGDKDIQLKLLLKKRKQIKAQLTRFHTFVRDFGINKSALELSVRLEKANELWVEFNDIQSKIECLRDDSELSASEEQQCSQQVEFENNFFESTTKAKEIIAHNTRSVTSQGSHPDAQRVNGKVLKLPNIKLVEFDGKYENWMQFYDTFNLLINNDDSLPCIQKFHYLKSALKGEAAILLDSIEVTDANYEVAWDMLKERYENKRVMVNTYVKSMFELRTLKQESYLGLRNLVDSFSRNIRSLRKLDALTTDNILMYMITNKVDPTTKRQWEEALVSKEGSPTIQELTKFLNDRCFVLESLDSDTVNNKNSYKKPSRVFSCTASNKPSCPFCKDTNHVLNSCPEILKLNVDDRWTEIKKMKLCVNCFRDNHLNYTCRIRGCRKCHRKHNTILHRDMPNETNLNNSPRESNNQTQANSGNFEDQVHPTTAMHCSVYENCTVLSTAVLLVEARDGSLLPCRALLDSGSQSNFICTELFNRLNVPSYNTNISVAGINNKLTYLDKQITAKLRSRFNEFSVVTQFLILDKITDNIPINPININNLKIPNNIDLADESFNAPQKIDMLLGASIFWNLLNNRSIKLNLRKLSLRETKLGWIITGSIEERTNKTISCAALTTDIQTQLEKFWRIEDCNTIRNLTPKEQYCEDLFVKTTTRSSDGRFCVKLPFSVDTPELGDSLNIAIKRFASLENKLANNRELKNDYKEFMLEYERLGHMTKLINPHNDLNTAYYLPHHCVTKASSLTTKLRVVFDASAKTTSGKSLNDILLVGPTIQDDLLSILLRFRIHNYVITADISKMYRQINISRDQCDFQRILWRNDPSEDLSHYQLNTLTYGTAPASFIATRCLKQLASEYENTMPEASKVILSDFYMDDLITGTNSLKSVTKLKGEVSEILITAGFVLRKWVSNNRNVFINDNNSDNISQYLITSDDIKTLGILWDSSLDILKYSIDFPETRQEITKRKILSVIAQIFDPLGLVGLVTINAKLILQKLWKANLDWDEKVPLEIQIEWAKLQKLLHSLITIKIPRQVTIKNWIALQIHGFCDASESAYGGCVYLKTSDQAGNSCVRLLCARSRVAPIKKITLPRLELCGAVLLANLVKKVTNSLKFPINDIKYWCDSTIVLSWIAAEPNDWQVFVANRVAEIQGLTNIEQWVHVSSSDNPADMLSRGVKALDPRQLNLWWSGPMWLRSKTQFHNKIAIIDDPPERRASKRSSCHLTNIDHSIFVKFSALSKLKNVFAYLLRFIKNVTTHKSNKLVGRLTINELNESMHFLTKLTQREAFEIEIKTLQAGEPLPNSSKLRSLNPFVDNLGILRVNGRLNNAKIKFEQKCPIILPSKHPFLSLIINYEHIRNMHAGTEATLAAVRTQFWPLHGRSTIRNVLHKCVRCARFRGNVFHPQMGPLPLERITPSRPFLNSGIDYAGPFLIKDGKLKNRKIIKAYLCLFVCFATKAVHLEVVGDLTTHSFLNAFKRFIARRGICKKIFSDNGTNFVGANRELKQLISLADGTEFQDYLQSNNIEWKFIPPRAPHFGGLWESAIKIAKLHLKKIVSDKPLSFEEITTVFCQIEAVLNSRPMTPLSQDPNDLTALTPGHFLIGDALTTVPEGDEGNSKFSHTRRYQLLKQMVTHFWQRWSKEYLSSLQGRQKWKKRYEEQIRVGSLVLIKEKHAPPLYWRLGRVVQLHPGLDAITRVVSVKTTSGVSKCAVINLCLLPVDE